jgi:hypothetical protein
MKSAPDPIATTQPIFEVQRAAGEVVMWDAPRVWDDANE